MHFSESDVVISHTDAFASALRLRVVEALLRPGEAALVAAGFVRAPAGPAPPLRCARPDQDLRQVGAAQVLGVALSATRIRMDSCAGRPHTSQARIIRSANPPSIRRYSRRRIRDEEVDVSGQMAPTRGRQRISECGQRSL
jgi:hypothetical protein